MRAEVGQDSWELAGEAIGALIFFPLNLHKTAFPIPLLAFFVFSRKLPVYTRSPSLCTTSPAQIFISPILPCEGHLEGCGGRRGAGKET